MAKLADQIEEMEEELKYMRGKAIDYEEENGRLKDEVLDLEDQVCDLEAYIDWINETYPDARTAYDAKCRLDTANANVG